ncbi:uncharacterized protein LTR77_007893 [Saxophila tyrrhenica]|uniref:Mitochondrial ribosomal protein S21 n=1 Tax=Saxophila tyrrhenica TaxID=1690608 RepID=A0AAV9P425_9PEZI|nr:hypothetical protein LTR77_007893 [Saxophila tyrrhenica]
MELFRAGEAILRTTQPLLPFLAPSAHRTPQRLGGIARHCGRQQLQHPVSRPLSTTCIRREQAAEPRRDDNVGRGQQSSTSAGEEFSALLDSALDGSKGVPTAPSGRQSRFKSASQQRVNQDPYARNAGPQTRTATQERPERSMSSADEMINEFEKKGDKKPSQFSGGMDSLLSSFSTNSSQSLSSPPPPPPEPQAAPMKLDSTVGRTIFVNNERGIDVGRAFRMLDQRCAQNSVKRDFMKQRFHERPGLKRKRLKQERWRRRFKETFRETVGMVQRMKKQGW